MVARPWEVFGPYEIDKHQEESWKTLAIEKIKASHVGLEKAKSVYVISVRNPKTHKIKYIGMTSKQNFADEMASGANVKKVFDKFYKVKSRTVEFWLFAKRTAKPNKTTGLSRWCKGSALGLQSQHLEELLIMLAKGAGHKLLNSKKIRSAAGKSVIGLFGVPPKRGARSTAVKSLADALKLR